MSGRIVIFGYEDSAPGDTAARMTVERETNFCNRFPTLPLLGNNNIPSSKSFWKAYHRDASPITGDGDTRRPSHLRRSHEISVNRSREKATKTARDHNLAFKSTASKNAQNSQHINMLQFYLCRKLDTSEPIHLRMILFRALVHGASPRI